MNPMLQWLEECGDSFYRAFIEKDRYLAYFRGFRTTLILSLFAVLLGVGILLLFSHSPISQPLTTQDVAMLSEEISYQYVPLYSGSDRTNVQASVQTTSNTYGENGKVTNLQQPD